MYRSLPTTSLLPRARTVRTRRVGRRALALAITATALAAGGQAHAEYTPRVDQGTLTLTGDGASDKLVLYANGAASLAVDVGADGTIDHDLDRTTFTAIDVDARGGDDEIHVVGNLTDEQLTLRGGAGDDVLAGGFGPDTLIGGSGDDRVDGNLGADAAALGSGNDRFQWDPGDASDTIEGQSGADTLDFNASNAGETMAATANGDRVRFTRNIGNVTLDIAGTERLAVRALGGADTMTVGDLTGTGTEDADIDLAAFGGGGDGQIDAVIAEGTEAADTAGFYENAGGISVDGLAAQTRVLGGEADDDFTLRGLGGDDDLQAGIGMPGPLVAHADGGAGADTVTYTGTPADDEIAVIANGAEVRTHVAGTAGLDSVSEQLVVRGLGGADTISAVGNLAALTQLTMDGGTGDDDVRGGNGADLLLGGSGHDRVDGNQGLDQAFLGSGNDRFQWDPGDGNDTVEGQSGADALDFNGSGIGEQIAVAADGERVRVTRNIANIVMDLDGVERVAPRPFGGADEITVGDLAGTDADVVDADLTALGGGGDGQLDSVFADGTAATDRVEIGESEGRPATRGLAARARMLAGEAQDRLVVRGLDGDDDIRAGVGIPGPGTVAADGGIGADTATYEGTAGDDQIAVIANGAVPHTHVAGSAGFENATEDLVVRGLGGADMISAVGNLAALTQITMDGGAGDDDVRGGNGADVLLGGSGHDHVDGNQGLDQAFLGGGDDRFQWDPGDGNDTVEGQSGSDALEFNGSNAGEIMEATAVGDRVRFTRNIANIAMDLAGVERLAVRALGSADTVIVNSLRGTAVRSADVDLGAFGGGGDGAQDTVVLNGTEARDVVRLTRDGDEALATGLTPQTRIAGGELLNDTLRINTLAGDDDVQVDPATEELITPVIDLGPDA